MSVIIEENNNWGHNDLLWKGNLKLRDNLGDVRAYIQPKSTMITSDKYGNLYNIIKYAYNNNVLKKVNDKDYFTLFRYSYGKANPPNCSVGPTLVISLFMPNSILHKSDYKGWMTKYLLNQLKLCVMFNYWFPNGNIVYYFDWYLFNHFAKNDNATLDISLYKIQAYQDFIDTSIVDKINQLLDEFYKVVKNGTFSNGLERILYYFTMATASYNVDGNLKINLDKCGDFFVYKFTAPFVENVGMPNEGHITDGYIGQHMRFVSLRQNAYEYNGIPINRHSHLVWRDAHATIPASGDAAWIRELHRLSNNKEIYFLPSTISYRKKWHGAATCYPTGKKYLQSLMAGIVQICNSSMYKNDALYVTTIGPAFILDLNDKLPIKSYRPFEIDKKTNTIRKEYYYGIDEYLLSSLFEDKYVRKHTIIFNMNLYKDIFSVNTPWYHIDSCVKAIALFILIPYLIKCNLLVLDVEKELIIVGKLLAAVEKLRNEDYKKHSPYIGLLLSIVPTMYNTNIIIFNSSVESDQALLQLPNAYVDGNPYSYNDLLKKGIDIPYGTKKYSFDKIDRNSLISYGMFDKTGALTTSALEWCQTSYISKQYVNYLAKSHSCADYFSGFYNAPHPDMDIVNLRGPDNLEATIAAMEKNTLLMPLNRSNYKLKAEKDVFRNAVNMDSDKLNKILAFGNASDLTKGINKEVAVWKALNYYGYDVPPEWFDRLELASESEYREFNGIVKELSSLKNWADNAVSILTGSSDLDKYKMELIGNTELVEENHEKIGGAESRINMVLVILIALSVILAIILIYLVVKEIYNYIHVQIQFRNGNVEKQQLPQGCRNY